MKFQIFAKVKTGRELKFVEEANTNQLARQQAVRYLRALGYTCYIDSFLLRCTKVPDAKPLLLRPLQTARA